MIYYTRRMENCVLCNIDRCEIWEVVCMFCMEELDEMAYFEIEYEADDSNESKKYDTEIYKFFIHRRLKQEADLSRCNIHFVRNKLLPFFEYTIIITILKVKK